VTDTQSLIDRLVADARPVRRLRSPALRAVLWLGSALLVIALLTLLFGLRADFAAAQRQPGFIQGLAASVATGLLAALAAFMAGLPDRSRLWALLPVPAAALWLASVGYGCLTNWVGITDGALAPGEVASCLATLALSSVPLSLVMFAMLRRTSRFRPTASLCCGSLAVAALSSTALVLLHPFDASALILAWTFGAAAAIWGADMLVGRLVLAQQG
jgi:hypothetical protein